MPKPTREQIAAARLTARDSFLSYVLATAGEFYCVSHHHLMIMDELERLEKGEIDRLAVFMPPRSGKALAKSTRVFTSKGWRQHGDLQAGDYVFSPSGHPAEVVAVGPDVLCPYRVSLSTGEAIWCHGDHEWPVFLPGSRLATNVETRLLAGMPRFMSDQGGENIVSLPMLGVKTLVPGPVAIAGVTYHRHNTKHVGNCIQVNHSTGLYVAGSSRVPTHNSELVSIRFPAYFLGRNPNKRVIATSHTDRLAMRNSRKVRAQLRDAPRWPFPEVTVSRGSGAIANWDITGYRGGYWAAGVRSAITGEGANLLIIDDPIKPLACDAPVPTPTGWTVMEKLEPGSQVFGPEGNVCNVTRVTGKQRAKRYRMIFNSGEYVDSHPTHTWLAKTRDSSTPREVKTHEIAQKLWMGWSIDAAKPINLPKKGINPLNGISALEGDFHDRLGRLRAVMDAYGFVGDGNAYCTIHSPEKQAELKELVASLGGVLVNEGSDTFRLTVRNNPFSLSRLAMAWKPGPKPNHVVRTVQVLPETDHLCISVDSPSHMFLAGSGMVPTCNSRAEADSPTIRDSLYEWFTDDALTRLEKNGSIVLVLCVTGDTPITMADGSFKRCDELRLWDEVETWREGRPHVGKVKKMACQGLDEVWEVRTSGSLVRANARHPFLCVREGQYRWVKLRDLVVGDTVVSRGARVDPLGGSGEEEVVRATGLGQDVARAQQAGHSPWGVLATLAIHGVYQQPLSGRQAFMEGYLRAMGHGGGASHVCSGHTAFIDAIKHISRSCGYWVHRPERVTSTESKCILSYGAPIHLPYRLSRVESIESVGPEWVYDIQVTNGESFVADGLVVHNTRWHEDDLAGRILNRIDETGSRWSVLSLPAIRKPGTWEPASTHLEDGVALWPEKFPLESLLATKADMSERGWLAEYQQEPSSLAGNLFKREWILRYKEIPASVSFIIQTVDTAYKNVTSADYSVIATWGRTESGYYLIDLWRNRVEFPELIDAVQAQYEKASETYRPTVYIEDCASGQSLVQSLQRDTRIPVVAYRVKGTKIARAEAVTPLFRSGRVFVPDFADWVGDWIEEHVRFPTAVHDDCVDTTSMALTVLSQEVSGVCIMESPKEDRASLSGRHTMTQYHARRPGPLSGLGMQRKAQRVKGIHKRHK